ncbi:hypothetical protein BVG16_23245 [Paenibacillus selenitireducens]|uniref:Uncharacterized protein n=1 Tax=Paenibacillus selenitireducens TaxID=1324314 RepID=A0A1T2X497_9BACL|nr:hypothetical protein [Paenibacillus selenitireducens]OPA74677.1 hypothetical protein BVG16_23245 [Paenibacillus selenitireducens]
MRCTGSYKEVIAEIMEYYERKEGVSKLWRHNISYVDTLKAEFHTYTWKPEALAIIISSDLSKQAVGYIYGSDYTDERVLIDALASIKTLYPDLSDELLRLRLYDFGLHYFHSADEIAVIKTINRLSSINTLGIDFTDKYWIDFMLEQYFKYRR